MKKTLFIALALFAAVTMQTTARADVINNSVKYINGLKLPAAYAFYDFEGAGSKIVSVATSYNTKSNAIIRYNDYAHDFA